MNNKSRKASQPEDPSADLLADGVVGIQEACQFLSCSRSWLYLNLDTPGGLPTVKVGGSRRIPRRALVRYLADRLGR